MADNSQIRAALEKQFPFLAEKIVTPRERRIFLEVDSDKFRDVLEFAVAELGYRGLTTITGFDEKDSLAALYHLANPNGSMLNIRTRVPKENPVMRSVTDLFPGGANYERELVDLLGFKIKGLPPGRRYPMPDDWPTDQFPLRKDWKPSGPVESSKAKP